MCETHTNEEDTGAIKLTVFLIFHDKKLGEAFQESASAVCLTCLLVFGKHDVGSAQPEQSQRKANSFKIGSEITRNWRPFKNIITPLFPQQEV